MPGEDLLTALHREVREETGLDVTECLAYLGSFDYRSGSGRATRQHTFAVTISDGDVVVTEHDLHHWAGAATERPVSDEVRGLLYASFGQ
ncbi:MAG: NUDIX hydrolase [Pseudonocardia sp.]|nr:NUDIX hydrolase [Pseudonocardia sp.]